MVSIYIILWLLLFNATRGNYNFEISELMMNYSCIIYKSKWNIKLIIFLILGFDIQGIQLLNNDSLACMLHPPKNMTEFTLCLFVYPETPTNATRKVFASSQDEFEFEIGDT